MILIADSGSTKSDWIAGEDKNNLIEFSTRGFNPFFHNQQFVLEELSFSAEMQKIKSQVRKIYFFGAGCSSPERKEIIRKPLSSFFPNAEVTVDHDMLGCALAVCEGKPGIACILGTGSNICFFDGRNVNESRHGLGYILGDEGSGSYYGKKILSHYLYGLLPQDLAEEFKSAYHIGKEDIIRSVYHEPNPNVFLASFAKFLSDRTEHEYIRGLALKGMKDFFETNVMSYRESNTYPVHFVGSVAWFFKDALFTTAKQYNVNVGNIIRKPVTGLANYFFNGGTMPG